MKDRIIKFIHKHPFLYNLAKAVNRTFFNRAIPKPENKSKVMLYTYVMEKEEEIELIRKDYEKLKTSTSQLFIIIKNPELAQYIHKYARENIDIRFADLNYFENYQKKLMVNRMMFLDYRKSEENCILKYIV